eukprot:CAMPEP_0171285400 /NCGR_PEP_ID=MMETSP0790-20130122/68429_1 /TAXON_ID=2925 /ORGANISM="Alexandrium catenella, Strain OF101" /LENGTH=121 /DNA_ID=CAMNT_0011754715 /DNA_START=17 /DNA_END=378 /DNA_ORIENTATION=+
MTGNLEMPASASPAHGGNTEEHALSRGGRCPPRAGGRHLTTPLSGHADLPVEYRLDDRRSSATPRCSSLTHRYNAVEAVATMMQERWGPRSSEPQRHFLDDGEDGPHSSCAGIPIERQYDA